MKWAEGPLLSFDIESTGVDVWSDRIVTASVVEIRSARRPASTTWLANPGVPIPAEATAVHGITDDQVQAHGRPPAEVLFEVTGRLALAMNNKLPVVGANLPYDLTLLEAENTRHGVPTLAERLGRPGRIGPCIDVMVLDRYADPYRKTCYKAPGCRRDEGYHECGGCRGGRHKCGGCGATDKTLASLCKHYGVLLGGAHTADADALAAARLFPRLLAAFPKQLDMPIGMLHTQQITWRRQQQASLADWFRRQGEHEKAESCNGDWPIQNRPAEDVALPGVAS